MRLGAVLTDLDGTLLEPDGSLLPEARRTLADLARAGIAVCPVTSKTVAEIELILLELGIACHAGFENGAGIRRADGAVEPSPHAVPIATLRAVHVAVRDRTGAPVLSFEELDESELASLTGLSGAALAAARQRRATLPLVVDRRHDDALRAALPADPPVRLVRGNRFLHLQGRHDKADLVPRLLRLTGRASDEAAACGDAPNDAGLLAAVGTRIIIPSEAGPHPELLRGFPDALVPAFPHGRGWAAAVSALVGGAGQGVGTDG